MPFAIVDNGPRVETTGRLRSRPERAPAMRMKWHDLLFMHWPVPADVLQDLLPSGIEIDTIDSNAWISVVPFRMSGVAPRWMPDVPWLSSFPELNVRTYVRHNGIPGVWFFSLDATNPLAVRIARRWFHLNYVDAKIRLECRDSWIRYSSLRTSATHAPAKLSVDYRPIGESYWAEPGSLDYWLTARYRLFTADSSGGIFCGEIDHAPWVLRKAQTCIYQNTMLDEFMHDFNQQPAFAQFACRTEVVAWSIEAV